MGVALAPGPRPPLIVRPGNLRRHGDWPMKVDNKVMEEIHTKR